ncbi:MAG: GNAT family N-acetyltransferase [Bacteroidales bacterium]|nr:GNAT family N-acetyltransferase [Bacteroidales bacterium]
MSPIIPPVSKELLLSELTKDKFLRKSNFTQTEIYVFDGRTSPNLMAELGRLREISFRMAGGGTGKETDIDEYDLADDPYMQLIVWDPEDQEIIGGYRYILGESVMDDPEGKLATSHLFEYSENFLKKYLPYTIELGRSFIQPEYQYGRNARKGLFALDNLWDGLGALTIEYPDIKYFFGKFTMYKSFDLNARNYILTFLELYFPDKQKLMIPRNPVDFNFDTIKSIFKGNDYQTDYKTLTRLVKENHERVPPLVNAYMNLSRSVITFGTVENDVFGGVEETGILVEIADIYNSKKDRHIKSYERMIKLNMVFPRRPKIFNLRNWRLNKQKKDKK